MKKYIIAYTPCQNYDTFLGLTYGKISCSEGYCIGENSIPHITLSQFYAEPEALTDIWNSVTRETNHHVIEVNFNEYSYLTFDGRVYWLSLLPSQTEELFEMHNTVSQYVDSIRKDIYDPHLTLFNFLEHSFLTKRETLESDVSIREKFVLSLGECDSFGQLTKIISSCDSGIDLRPR